METESSLREITERTILGKTVIDGKRQSNAGAITLHDYILAFDPTPEAETAYTFRKLLEDKYNLPIKYLAISHYHWDHTFGTKAFEEVTIIGSEKLLKILQYKKATDWKNLEQEIIYPNLLFKEKMVIQNDDLTIKFYHAGGHTEDSIYAYVPQEKVLFAGDLVFSKLFPWAGDNTCNPDQWINVFEEFLNLDFKYLVPGHGPLTDKKEIKLQLKNLENVRKVILDAIEDNIETSKIVLPEFYEPLSPSSITRTIEHFYRFYANQEDNKSDVKIW